MGESLGVTMKKHTIIIGGENIFETPHSFLRATVESVKQDPESIKDFRVLSFMPCLHRLAGDNRGFFVSGVGGRNASVPEMLCPLLGESPKDSAGLCFRAWRQVARKTP